MQIHTPRQLVAALPHLIGFHPSNSLVMAVIDNKELTAIARLELPERQIPMPVDIEGALATAKEGNLVLIIYSDSDITLEKAVSLVSGCEHLDLLDALWVNRGHWGSMMCHDVDCCPVDGHALSDITDVDVEFIIAGSAPFASRDDMVQQIQEKELSKSDLNDRNQAIARVAKQVETSLKKCESPQDETSSEETLTEVRNKFVQQIIEVISDFEPLDWFGHARLCAVVSDIRMRDGLLRTLFEQPQIRTIARSHFMAAISRAQASDVPALATVLAGTAWLDGNGALATIAIERALDADPSYSLARLLDRAITHGVPPSVWADSLEAVSYQECLAGAA